MKIHGAVLPYQASFFVCFKYKKLQFPFLFKEELLHTKISTNHIAPYNETGSLIMLGGETW
jgi:hypothetical protein